MTQNLSIFQFKKKCHNDFLWTTRMQFWQPAAKFSKNIRKYPVQTAEITLRISKFCFDASVTAGPKTDFQDLSQF